MITTMIINDHHLTVEEEESSFKLNATSEHVEQVSGGAAVKLLKWSKLLIKMMTT